MVKNNVASNAQISEKIDRISRSATSFLRVAYSERRDNENFEKKIPGSLPTAEAKNQSKKDRNYSLKRGQFGYKNNNAMSIKICLSFAITERDDDDIILSECNSISREGADRRYVLELSHSEK